MPIFMVIRPFVFELRLLPFCIFAHIAVLRYRQNISDRTPLIQCPFFPVLKRTKKNHHFRVFIMIKIGQTYVFLKDYVHIHQTGSYFMGGYRLGFSPIEQETKTSILQAFSTR